MSLRFKHERREIPHFDLAGLRRVLVSFNERDTLVFENAAIND
jgi:hypothetical protein